ncbi:MAG: hypothetical protein ACLT98_10090 [Eggerthellaceae bacterium]
MVRTRIEFMVDLSTRTPRFLKTTPMTATISSWKPGQEKTFIVTYQLWEGDLSRQQWEHVFELPYRLVYLDYPEKYAVDLTDIEVIA